MELSEIFIYVILGVFAIGAAYLLFFLRGSGTTVENKPEEKQK